MAPIICWFRQDLRIADNVALSEAVAAGRPVVCVYVLDDETAGKWRPGSAARWWIHHSMQELRRRLAEIGGTLVLRRGASSTIIPALAAELGATTVYWNRCYEPYALARDAALQAALAGQGIEAEGFAGSLLREPAELKTGTGTPFKVFTPFWRAFQAGWDAHSPLPAPRAIRALAHPIRSDRLEDWDLTPRAPDWACGFAGIWRPGEAGAVSRLGALPERLASYRALRDRPARDATSRLSPHLHFGEISPRQVWHAVNSHCPDHEGEKFLSELGWREFSHHLLFHNPSLPHKVLDPKFRKFPWQASGPGYESWTRGKTGFPIVDAGMRELWTTGWMHNRVRMISASFLVKHLGVDWRSGADWFWDTLVDADLANNAASWQWVAGCGADAAPFFRIFNPVLQGERFDPDGSYVRHWLPELAHLPDAFIHKPWLAPSSLAARYPAPVVDLAEGRRRALQAYKSLSTP